MNKSIELCSFKTSIHACSIETIHNNDKSNNRQFVCGLYQLDSNEINESCVRLGGLIICTLECENESVNEKLIDSSEIYEVSGGVLDLKIKHDLNDDCNYLIDCLSNGTMNLYQINNSSFAKITSYEDFKEGMFLSIDWLKSSNKIAVSTQNSSVIILSNDGNLQCINKLTNIHKDSRFHENMPVWVVTFNQHDQSGNCLLTGGDDNCLKLWDLRQSNEMPVHNDKTNHLAGVTSCQYHPIDSNIFVTGSYDNNIRIFDYRQMNKPILGIKSDGGVWKSKWDITSGYDDCIITANMQGGCQVQSINLRKNIVSNIITYIDNKHSNYLAYGIDIIDKRIVEQSNCIEYTFASTSFYENTINIWKASI